MPSLSRETTTGLIWLVVVVIVWTSFHIVTRYGVQHALTAWDLVTLRLGIAGIVLLPWLARQGLGGLSLGRAALLFAAGGPAFAYSAFGGYQFAPAAHGASILAGTLPVFTAPLAWWLAGEKLSGPRLIGLLAIFTGGATLVADALSGGGPGAWRGDALFVLGAFSWSLFAVLVKTWNVAPLRAAAIVSVGSLLTVAPFNLLFLPSHFVHAELVEIAGQAIYHGFFGYLVSLVGYSRATLNLGATATSMAIVVVPGSVALLAWLLLDEPVGPLCLAGVALVSGGLLATGWAAATAERRRRLAAVAT
ncbi:MAG: DMT family transporter [Alphaproteobacteria bacterium]